MTTEPRTLLMGFHCHQPVGNFHSVLHGGCRDCYGPLLEELSRHPSFRFAFHVSGWLLEWIEREEKGIFSVLRELARRGQAELVTAGFFEPILSVIPPEDALGQIGLMSDYLEEVGGVRPAGLWLTERIWEPALVPVLAEAGVRYTVVDDNHLLGAGYREEQLGGHFVTETRGQTMSLFPINQKLRYATPFSPVPSALRLVEEVASAHGGAAIVFDDGEKFGMWPGTKEWVYEKGWLRDFLGAVCAAPGLATETFRSYLDRTPPVGRAHLPPGSYFEMGEWTLPAQDASEFHELFVHLTREGRAHQARRYLRGGLWPNFFIKYPESNNLHKKMLRISRRVRASGPPSALRSLFMGQCNDAYWHGIFGGLYLPVLRNGVVRELNAAERELDEDHGVPGPVLSDVNADGIGEAELRSRDGVAVLTAMGGQLYELSDKKSGYNLLGTLARRQEAYHLAAAHPTRAEEGGVATIHEAARAMSPEAVRALVFDRQPRYSFIDRFLPPGASLADHARGQSTDLGDFAQGIYALQLEGGRALALRNGRVGDHGRQAAVSIKKSFALREGILQAECRVEGAPRGCAYAVELNLHLPSGTGASAALDGREFGLGAEHAPGSGTRLSLTDPALCGEVAVEWSPAARLWSFPVFTVSQSEKGFDLTYQGSCFVILWEVQDHSGNLTVVLNLGF